MIPVLVNDYNKILFISVFKKIESCKCSEIERSHTGKRHSVLRLRIHASEFISVNEGQRQAVSRAGDSKHGFPGSSHPS